MRAKNTCSHGPTFVRKAGRRLFTSLQIALPNFSGRQPLFSDCSTFRMAFAKLSPYCAWEREVWHTCRCAVKPVWKSPGSTTQTWMPNGFYFLVKRFTISFNRELGCTVEGLERNGKDTCDGTDIYDSSVSCFAHERQHHRTHTDGTREIRIHLVLYLLLW